MDKKTIADYKLEIEAHKRLIATYETQIEHHEAKIKTLKTEIDKWMEDFERRLAEVNERLNEGEDWKEL
jgi:hypothetical protein